MLAFVRQQRQCYNGTRGVLSGLKQCYNGTRGVLSGLKQCYNGTRGVHSGLKLSGPKGTTLPLKPDAPTQLPLHSIIKVTSTATAPHFYLPWQKKASKPSYGSGFILETDFGKSLITNAHLVADETYLSVRRCRSPVSYRAHVEAISHESDLAILSVEDKSFWVEKEDTPPLKLGRLPNLQDHVNVVGFPTGGEGVSVTRGVVSRIEPIQYAHGSILLLGVQIDASINPGNSGGPALIEASSGNGAEPNHVVGVAFQSLVGADNIGYIIPPPVINHFLTQYHLHKKYTGFPQLGIQWQTLENTSFRNYFKLDKSMTGVLVARVSPVSPAHQVLMPDDVILSIDGNKIADNGTVDFIGGERVYLNYLFVYKFVGDMCNMEILRSGVRHEVTFPLISSNELALVPVKSTGMPSYLVYGGFIFTKLTIPYLREFESSEDQENWYDVAPRMLVHKALHGFREDKEQEIVILSHVLADDLNYGFTHLYNLELEKFNGKKVKNLKNLFDMVQSCKDEFARFDFADKSTAILEVQKVKHRNKMILKQYAIPVSHSQDLDGK